MKLYDYNQQDSGLTFDLKETRPTPGIPDAFTYKLQYRSPYVTGNKLNDRVYCEIYSPDRLQQPSRLLIFLHGFSTRKNKMDNYYHFIKQAVNHGYTCAFPNLPLHLNRAPEDSQSGKELIYYDDLDTMEYFHQCVVDIRRLIDIMHNWPVTTIHICGLSMGSIVSVLTMAHEPRIDKGVLLIGGAHWEQIHWNGILRFVLKGNCADHGKINRSKCHSYYSHFPAFLKQFKASGNGDIDTEKLKSDSPDLAKMCFLCDPLAFAHRLDPQQILMINARFDFYFSRKSTLMLHKELGQPEIHWMANFHSSKILTDSRVINKIFSFFKS
ncbi:MAG: lysophospholipase [Actinomycetia bacterium]|nr:lysophospholipase [Actinomycetes bacterium]